MLKSFEKLLEDWEIFDDFGGYQTKYDPSSKLTRKSKQSPTGQNTAVDAGVIGTRNGSGIVGATSALSTPITSQWTYRLRNGSEIEMRAYGTVLEYRVSADTVKFHTLKSGFTSGQKFGHAEQNVNADAVSYLYFCNAKETAYRWAGITATYASNNGVDQITMQGSVSLATLGFTATGTFIINGTEVTYTGLSGQTFTGCNSIPAGMTAGDYVAQSPLAVAGIPLGNIMMVKDARLFVAGVIGKESTLYYSKITDATDFTYSSPRTANQGGIIDTPEGGGAIINIAQDENLIYIIKATMVKTLQFQASTYSNMDDFPVLTSLKSYDGKSQSLGGVNSLSCWTGPNGVFFLNQNNELMYLTRLEGVDKSQAVPISQPIEPTFQSAVFTASSGITYKNKAYISAMQDSTFSFNNVVFVYDLIRKEWDLPIIGWNVADWNVIGNVLHWGSSTSPESYQMISDKTDKTLGITANWRSWRENFDIPHYQKTIDCVFVDGYIKSSTTLNISLLYDENGFTSLPTGSISGTASAYLFSGQNYNVFGLNPFGYERFGSNVDLSGLIPFRAYFPLKSNIDFFNIQIDFASDGQGQDWQILRFGYHLVDKKRTEQFTLLKQLI